MDKISVTDTALQNAYTALQQLESRMGEISEKCVSGLTAQLDNLDDGLKKDIQAHMDEIARMREKLGQCMTENMSAIRERYGKISEYEALSYHKRNIY